MKMKIKGMCAISAVVAVVVMMAVFGMIYMGSATYTSSTVDLTSLENKSTDIKVKTNNLPGTITDGSFQANVGTSGVIPKGIWTFYPNSAHSWRVDMNDGSTWITVSAFNTTIQLVSDGTNVRITNTGAGTQYIRVIGLSYP